MDYTKMYCKINKDTISKVKGLIKEGFYKKDELEQTKMIRKLCNELSSLYKIEEPDMIFASKNYSPCYDMLNNRIFLTNLSIISFLHEFKHCIQDNNKQINTEKIARGWSLSVFKQAVPKMFKKSVSEGKVMFV